MGRRGRGIRERREKRARERQEEKLIKCMEERGREEKEGERRQEEIQVLQRDSYTFIHKTKHQSHKHHNVTLIKTCLIIVKFGFCVIDFVL